MNYTRSMRTRIMLLLLLCQNCLVYAQDGAFMGYQFSIQFDQFQPKDSNDSIVSVVFYRNVTALSRSKGREQKTNHLLRSDLDSAFFVVSEGHSFIGSSPKTITPPTLFMNIEIQRRYADGTRIKYIKTIPILFDAPMKNFAQIALTNVNIQPYLGISSGEIALRVLSESTFEIIDQTSLETQPMMHTLLRYD